MDDYEHQDDNWEEEDGRYLADAPDRAVDYGYRDLDGLTEDQQKILLEAAELAKHEQREIERGMAVSGRKAMEEYGIIISDIEQSEWIEATKSVYDDASLGIDPELLAKIKAVTDK